MSKRDHLSRLLRLNPVRRRRGTPQGPPPPAPEVIDGGEWEIRQAQVLRHTSVAKNRSGKGGTLVVPFGDEEQARLVRARELTRIHASPDKWPRDLNDEMMQLLEDGRIHRHLNTTGFDIGELTEVLQDAALKPDELQKQHPAMLGALVVATYRTGEEIKVDEALNAIGRDDIYEVGHQIAQQVYWKRDRPTVEHLGEAADLLVRALGDPDEPPPPPPAPAPEPKAGEPPPPPPVPPVRKAQPKFQSVETLDWGEMTIVEVPLTRRLANKLRGRRRPVQDIRGRRLRRVTRLHVDGKVFVNRPPRPGGGAVLIDTSNSMALSNAQVEKIVEELPGGIVASYSGNRDRKTGELRVIARNGSYAERGDIRAPGPLNIIDGRALAWLAKQRGPRYWVSDGCVTGIGEKQSPILLAEVERICRVHQIIRVKDVRTLLGN